MPLMHFYACKIEKNKNCRKKKKKKSGVQRIRIVKYFFLKDFLPTEI